RGKEHHGVRDVLRGTQAPHGDPVHQRSLPFLSVPSPLPFRGRVGRTKPGATLLTVIPNGPSSCASCRVKPTTACFAEQYAWMPVSEEARPAPELMLIIRPLPACFMPAATARLSVKAVPMLTAKIRSQSASGTSSMGRICCSATPPALLTSTSTAPAVVRSICAIHAAAAARSVRSSTSVSTPAPAVSASSAAERSQPNTHAPSCAKVSAMHRPNPCPAPLTTTVFPSNRIRIGRTLLYREPVIVGFMILFAKTHSAAESELYQSEGAKRQTNRSERSPQNASMAALFRAAE